MQTVFFNCTILSGGQRFENKAVIVKDEYIHQIISENDLPENTEKIDLKGAYLAPGFIDLQIMGAGGALFGGLPSEEGLDIMEKELLKSGTVGFLPTVSTNTPEVIDLAIAAAVNFRSHSRGTFLGLHLEGPYINPGNRGAHPEKFIKKASLEEVKALIDAAHGEIKMMTLAPELQDDQVINYLLEHAVVLAMGHSGANYESALRFLNGRKKAATHLFNGMPPVHHRSPGLIPAIFDQKPYTSIVADGIHVAFPMIKMAKSILGDALYLISDAATPAEEGIYKHTFRGDRYVTKNEDGTETLSGSALTMLKAVQNCVAQADIDLPEAINMATLYPSRVLGLQNKKGLIKDGYEAGMVAFDSNYKISQVIYRGQPVL